MPHKSMPAAVTAAAVLLVPILAAADRSQDEIQRVLVTNFPQTQRITGAVSVEGLVKHAQLQRLKEIVVPPVGPRETTRLIQAGVLSADGFTSVVLSLDGVLRGKALQAGTVGGILIPDEESVERAFQEEGHMQFKLEIAAPSAAGGSVYFASQPERSTVAFPRYRVFLYNTTDKTATINLYAYLTN